MKTKILDHGYVEFIEAWGKGKASQIRDEYCPSYDYECGIIEAARQSTQGAFRDWAPYQTCERCGIWHLLSYPQELGCISEDGKHTWKKYPKGDEGLLQFLFNSKPQHATPFEFAGLIIEVRAPIFVFREWMRHRTQSFNEMSARYAPLPSLDYLPTLDRIMMGAAHATATTNKQAQSHGGVELDGERTMAWLSELEEVYQAVERHYQLGLQIGNPKELARCSMVVSRYTQMRASANLRNWLAFLTLREDKGAQWEIRQFANALGAIIKEVFPRTWKLFDLQRGG